MSNAVFKMMIRVITKRMADGEAFEEIIKDYPKLTDAEVEKLKKAIV